MKAKLNLPKNAMPLRRLFNTTPYSARVAFEAIGADPNQFLDDGISIRQSKLFETLRYREQVFPPEGMLYEERKIYSGKFRVRANHSEEVGPTGRMIANDIVSFYPELEEYHIPDAADVGGLGHDIGTPPLSHTGENSTRAWFRGNYKMLLRLCGADPKEIKKLEELSQYEGNANILRFATSEEYLSPALSVAVIAGMLKYPFGADIPEGEKPFAAGKHKIGFYSDDSKTFKNIALATGLKVMRRIADRNVYARHPLAHIVKAADFITYAGDDVADSVLFGHLSLDDAFGLLWSLAPAASLKGLSKQDPKAYLDQACKLLRRKLAKDAADSFIRNKDAIFAGTFQGDLLQDNKAFSKAYNHLQSVFEKRVLGAPEIQRHRSIFTADLMVVLDSVTHVLKELDKYGWDTNGLNSFTRTLHKNLIQKIPGIFPEEENMRYVKSIGFAHMLHYALDAIALVPRDRMMHDVAVEISQIDGIRNILTNVARKHIGLAKAFNPKLQYSKRGGVLAMSL